MGKNRELGIRATRGEISATRVLAIADLQSSNI